MTNPVVLPRSRRTVAVIAALVTLLGLSVPFVVWWLGSDSSASFADSEVLEANHLGAATLDLEVGADRAAFSAENLAPGDEVSGQLVVSNAGTLPLRWGMAGVGDGGLLGEWLRFEVWQSTTTCSPNQAGDRFVSDVLLTPSPTILVQFAGLGSTFPEVLRPGESATLCLGASLPLSAPNEVQGRRLEVSLTLTAEHAIEVDS